MFINARTLLTKIGRPMLLAALIALSFPLFAQPPGGGGQRGGFNRQAMNVGHFYGKVVDENGKGVSYAAVQLFGMKFDTVSRKPKETLIAGQITEENGDFSLEKLPVMGEFTLKISYLGYIDIEKKVSFGLTRESMRNRDGGRPGGGFAGMGGNFDVDLGNIPLVETSETLETVTVTGEINQLTLALDRKSYRVDKNSVAAGGTAEDALRNVPSISVDIDGNLTVRNAAPQLFVDGRPTTLTLDQIAADAIETVEVITNPSAKYDASGGQAGIVNIVLKKDRRIGYNGSVRLNADTRGSLGGSFDINAREGKFNAFVGANYFGRKSIGESETERQNLFGNPLTNQFQLNEGTSDGYFARARAGLDWFMDNRNTITFEFSMMEGNHGSEDVLNIRTDSLYANRTASSEAVRNSLSDRIFRNKGGSILYKHLFPKKGKELTADVNFNKISFDRDGNYNTIYNNGFQSQERQLGDGNTTYYTGQIDYVDPLSDKLKLEAGARISVRSYKNFNSTAVFDSANDVWLPVSNFADRYNYEDKVYAAYATLSYQLENWGFMAGLRAESSQYDGVLPDEGLNFQNDYPLSLFPSIFVTRKFSDSENMQLSYSRRINRPSFFNLMPFTDFSDSLNLRRGNPNLLPEFTNSLEASYQKIFEGGHNLLVSVYYKQASDLITTYQYTEYLPELEQEFIISSYTNSNSSQAYGLELTLRNTLSKKMELSSNINLYQSKIDATNVESGLSVDRFSWFVKENLTVKLPASFTFQLSGEYRSKAAFSPMSNSGRFRGHHRRSTNTAQGYTKARWFVDLGLRKDLFKRKVNMTLSVSDIFRTRISGSYTESEFFIQDSWRIRNPQTARLSLSYRFGKADTSLFKRKNMKQNTEGMDMMN